MNLKNHPLFQDLSESDLNQLYHAACMRSQFFEKNQTVFHAGDRICEVGIVQTGNVHIEMIDLWGNKSILSSIAPGQIFAETYAICRKPLLVDVTAAAPCEILFLNLEFLARSFSEPGSCPRRDHAKSFCHLCPEKSDSLQPNLLHHTENRAWQAACISLLRVGKSRLHFLYHPLRPAGNGRLSESGPQCTLKGTWAYEERRNS